MNIESDDERWPGFLDRPDAGGSGFQSGTHDGGGAGNHPAGILGDLSGLSAGGDAAESAELDAQKSRDPSFLDDLLGVGEKIWTSPNTALGVVAGLAGIPFGGSLPRFEHGGVVFNNYPWGPGGAMTLGDAILSTSPDVNVPIPTYSARSGAGGQNPIVNMGSHEEGHIH